MSSPQVTTSFSPLELAEYLMLQLTVSISISFNLPMPDYLSALMSQIALIFAGLIIEYFIFIPLKQWQDERRNSKLPKGSSYTNYLSKPLFTRFHTAIAGALVGIGIELLIFVIADRYVIEHWSYTVIFSVAIFTALPISLAALIVGKNVFGYLWSLVGMCLTTIVVITAVLVGIDNSTVKVTFDFYNDIAAVTIASLIFGVGPGLLIGSLLWASKNLLVSIIANLPTI